MNIKQISKISSRLSIFETNQICKLKNSFWKFGMISQRKWFKKNVKKNYIHNFVKKNNEIIAYTMLRNCKYAKNQKKYSYYLFDTLIIKKKYRNEGYSRIIMDLNSKIIKKNKKISILFCTNEMQKFYKKHGWRKLAKKEYKLIDFKTTKNVLIFNDKKNKKNYKIEYFIK